MRAIEARNVQNSSMERCGSSASGLSFLRLESHDRFRQKSSPSYHATINRIISTLSFSTSFPLVYSSPQVGNLYHN
jgi:hypothetical protein